MTTKTIGSQAVAQHLHRHYEGDPFNSTKAPRGFNRVGAGAYRAAILDKSDNTVYKIGDSLCNRNEAQISRKLRRRSTRNLGFELIIPHSRTYRVKLGADLSLVGAQQFAANARNTYCNASEGTYMLETKCSCKRYSDICYDTVHDRVREFSGIGDIHSGNILVDKAGCFWLIDMGEEGVD